MRRHIALTYAAVFFETYPPGKVTVILVESNDYRRITVTVGNAVRHGRTAMAGVLRGMGNDVQFDQRLDELPGIVALVGPKSDFSRFVSHLARISNHGIGGFPLGIAIGRGNDCTDNQTMAVVAQSVSYVTHPTGSIAFAAEPGIRVSARGVSVVTSRLALAVIGSAHDQLCILSEPL